MYISIGLCCPLHTFRQQAILINHELRATRLKHADKDTKYGRYKQSMAPSHMRGGYEGRDLHATKGQGGRVHLTNLRTTRQRTEPANILTTNNRNTNMAYSVSLIPRIQCRLHYSVLVVSNLSNGFCHPIRKFANGLFLNCCGLRNEWIAKKCKHERSISLV